MDWLTTLFMPTKVPWAPRASTRGGQLEQRVDMIEGSDEDVTFEHRPMIQEGDQVFGPGHDSSWQLPGDDLADHILLHKGDAIGLSVAVPRIEQKF
jgi:hypothetical protein